MKFLNLAAAAALLCGACAPCAQASLQFDQNVTNSVIFGSGNANGGFTVDRANGVEVGLRAKIRWPAPQSTYLSQGDGTYGAFDAGNFGPGGNRASWSFDWSINTDYLGTSGLNLDDLTYSLSIDYSPGPGINALTFDPINVAYADHSIGDNSTPDNGGAEAADAAGYSTLIANNNLAQNSWQLNFFTGPESFDPSVSGNYFVTLSASDLNGVIASTRIQVLVGDAGAVPEATSLAAWSGLSIAGAYFWRRRRRSA
ncbi:MAG: hypothetical protein KDA44_06580 [Planctomycetales bacterium]|nr:hypothetical protein [Planctomycetales bacterium]